MEARIRRRACLGRLESSTAERQGPDILSYFFLDVGCQKCFKAVIIVHFVEREVGRISHRVSRV